MNLEIDREAVHKQLGASVLTIARKFNAKAPAKTRVVEEDGDVRIEILDKEAVQREYAGSPWVMQWLGGGL